MATKTRDARYRLHNLKPGDILLSTVPKSPISRAIRVATQSPFSHAAIFWRDFTFLEARDVGVANFSLLRKAIHSQRNVRVLRLADRRNAASKGHEAARAAVDYIGREYWLGGAALSPLRVSRDNPEGRLFCSHFVAQSYEDIGVALCPGLDPKFVKPSNLCTTPILRDVTEDVVYRLDDPVEASARFDLIDGPEHESTPQDVFRRESSAIMSEVRRLFARENLQTPKSLPEAIALLLRVEGDRIRKRVDHELSSILRQSGYETLPKRVFALAGDGIGRSQALLDEIPTKNLRATLEVQGRLLADWRKTNDERKRGIDAFVASVDARLVETLALQAAHELNHWREQERNIEALQEEIAKIARIIERREGQEGD